MPTVQVMSLVVRQRIEPLLRKFSTLARGLSGDVVDLLAALHVIGHVRQLHLVLIAQGSAE